MMPARLAREPADHALRSCLRKYRSTTARSAWKAFRQDACGLLAVKRLHDAYGPRCVYCDHAQGRTIDHVAAKGERPRERFRWSNFRPSCADCNNLKGTKRIVDPARRDPRDYVVLELATGAPIAIGSGRARSASQATRRILDNQTLNEARRALRALNPYRVRVDAALAKMPELAVWAEDPLSAPVL